MEPPKLLGVVLTTALLFHIALTAKQAVVSRKSKLCGNVECEEVLFKARVKRVMGINNDPSFLNLAENAIISVVAVKFSDRPDIMEGKLNGEGSNGFFYAGAIDIMPFAEFLRTAITDKKEMLMISQNPADIGDKRIVGFLHSETDLVRDFNAKNAQAAAENGLPAPEPIPIPEPAHTGHGHSHGGHGHSHGGHGHSHGHPAPTPAPTPAPKPIEEAPKPAEEPVKPADLEMDAEIERLIKEEEERMKNVAEQPPLVLQSLPETPEAQKLPEEPLEPVTPEPIPEAPVPIAQYIQEPTTTPAPLEAPAPVENAPNLPTPTFSVDDLMAQAARDALNSNSIVPDAPKVEEPEPAPTPAPAPAEDPVVTPAPEELTTPPPPAPPPPAPAVPEEAQAPTPAPEEAPEAQIPAETAQIPPENAVPEAPEEPAPTTTPPPISAGEAEFLKWEEARQKREAVAAAPYEDAQAHQFVASPPPHVSSGLIELIRSSLGLGNITDSSVLLVVNLTFVAASFLVYIIIRSLSSGGESDILDRQAHFDLMNKHKQLQLQLNAKITEIQNLQANGAAAQRPEQPNYEPELLALRQQLAHLQSELQTAHAQRQEFEIHYHQIRELAEQKDHQIAQLTEQANDYQERLEKSQSELQELARHVDSARAELMDSQTSDYGRQQELMEKQAELEQIYVKIDNLTAENRDLTDKIAQLQVSDSLELEELEELRNKNLELQEQVKQLKEELEKEKSVAGSGNSGGWSDIDDNEVVEAVQPIETTPISSENSENLKKFEAEIAELKASLEKTEKELTKYRNLYNEKLTAISDKENRSQIEMEHKLKNAESDLQEAKRRAEEIGAEKKELSDRLNEMLKNLNQSMQKSAENDKMLTQLREEAFAKEKQLLEHDSVLRKKDDKIRELDAEFKRVKMEYVKLETKSFHDVRKLNMDVEELKTQLSMAGGVTSSRSIPDRLVSPLQEPIWDEPEPALQRVVLPLDGYSSMRRRSTRRSQLPFGAESPSDQEKKQAAPSHRRRSRSHGRQPPSFHDPYSMNPYLPGSSDSSFMSTSQPQFLPLNRQHSRSGHLMSNSANGPYSSGGSNGGRSPPPEMPLLSAIPPPGARKPLGKRPDSAHHLGK